MGKIRKLFIFLFFFSCFLFFSANIAKAELTEVSIYYLITPDTTPLIRGTVDDSDATVTVTVEGQAPQAATVEEDGDWSLQLGAIAAGEYGIEAEAVLGLTEISETLTEGLYITEGFPVELYFEGDDTLEVESIVFLEELEYSPEDNSFSVLFPAGTEIARTGGGTFDIEEWYLNSVELESDRIISELRFGVPSIDLTFSQNVTITFNVGSDYNGRTLYIFTKSDGGDDTGWESLANCAVADSECSFQVSHASYFAISEDESLADDDGHRGVQYDRYKHYKKEYKSDKNKNRYFTVRQIKKENPALFWELHSIYLQYKTLSDKELEQLSLDIQEKFKLYEGYHGYKKYRELKEKVN
jgi:hypothetical protein